MLLNFTVAFLCFVLLPGVIIVRGIEATLAGAMANESQKKQQKLVSALDELEFFSANPRFAHHLLTHLCRSSEGEKLSRKHLRRKISRIKQLFPDSFTFVVADPAGKLIKELSDESGYLYLYRKAFNLIRNLQKNIDKESPVKAIEDLDTTITRLRPLLGELLRGQDLFFPLHDKKNGRSILTSGSEKKFHIWYGEGKDFLLIAYISRSFIRGTPGVEWATRHINSPESDIVTGYSQYPPTQQSLNPPLSEVDSTMMVKALARAEEVGGQIDPQDLSKQIATRYLNQDLRGFSYFKSESSAEAARNMVYARFFLWALVFCFIFFVRQLRFPISLTVKIKITAFFAYAIILPILVIGSLASQFLQQAEAEMTSVLQRRSQRLVEKIDSGYSWFKDEKAARISKFLQEEFAADPELFKNKSKARQFNKKLAEFSNHGELMVVDDSGKDHLLGISPKLTANASLVRTMSKETVIRMLDPDARNLDKRTSSFHMYTSMYRDQDHIEYFGIGEMDLNVFLKMLITPNFSLGYVVLIFWQESGLNEEFILKNQHRFQHPKAKFTVYNTERRKFILSSGFNSGELLELCKKVENRRIGIQKKLRIDGHEYIAMAMPGQKLEKMVLSAMFPAEIVSKKINSMKTDAFLLMTLLVSLSAATIFLLRNWFFRPLAELKVGIDAFSQRNFQKRLKVLSSNEFGKLMLAFNESFETLQDLEVARIVQESVLPEPYLKLGNFEIVAKTEIMTRLGGDYFDILPQEDDSILMFIGDATGHGIPAALTMAMAKSVMIHESVTGLDPIKLMDKLHQLFKSIRKTGSKDFMTAACIYANSADGSITVVNAGHCHPLLVKHQNESVEIFELTSGMPLGFGNKRRFFETKLSLNRGDVLVFYTDGFYECTNQQKEMLGFDGFKQVIEASKNSDLKVFSENIFRLINKWEAASTDDKTLLLVKMQ